jgi:hypothetical protein
MRSFDPERLREAVREARSAAHALRLMERVPAGGNYKTLYARIQSLGLDRSHWTGQGHLRGRTHTWARKMELSAILVEASPYQASTSALKRRLLDAGLLVERCIVCGIKAWLGRDLSLHLDHINGIADDHRLSNLRLLCPNCHSQTPTYCGLNKKRKAVARTNSQPPTSARLA